MTTTKKTISAYSLYGAETAVIICTASGEPVQVGRGGDIESAIQSATPTTTTWSGKRWSVEQDLAAIAIDGDDLEEGVTAVYLGEMVPVVAWGSYGQVGTWGGLRRTRAAAERVRNGDRQVVAVGADGTCYAASAVVDGMVPSECWVPGPGGRSCGAARYTADDMASI